MSNDELIQQIKAAVPMTKFLGPAGSYVSCHIDGCDKGRKTCQVFEDGTYCHKCHTKQDIFDYIMRTRNVEFGEAKRILAADGGIPLRPDPERSKLLVKCMVELNNQLFLHQPEMLAELIQWRGWTRQIIGQLNIGYCDPDGKALERTGIPHETLVALGFYRQDWDNTFIFADRFTFPIRNKWGDVVSMKGRLARGYTEQEQKDLGKSKPLRRDGPWGPHSHLDYLFLEECLNEAKRKGFIFITEGEPNAVSIRMHGLPVGGLQTNKGLAKFAWKLAEPDQYGNRIRRIYIVLDNDFETRKTLLREIYDLQLALPDMKIVVVTLPYLKGEDKKVDVDEYFHDFHKTLADFHALCKGSPDACEYLIRELGKNARSYGLLYPLVTRLAHRKDDLLRLFSEVSGRPVEWLEFAATSSPVNREYLLCG